MVAVAPTADGPDALEASRTASPGRRARRAFNGARFRILGWFILLLIAAILGSLLVQRAVLERRLTAETDEFLSREAESLRSLVSASEGESAAAIFKTFLTSHVPTREEAYLAIVDGKVVGTSRTAPYRLDKLPDATRQWSELRRTTRGWLHTPVGQARYLAVPVQRDGRVQGVFVAARFPEEGRKAIASTLRVGGLVALSVLFVTAILAWAAAGRVLAPVRLVTETARSISETDLHQRIPVRTDDEIGELSRTFNAMLDRLETALAAQRQFVSDAGHELRTPITVIRGHLEVLGDDPKEREETIDLVTDELDRMSRMVNDLLLLAKAERPGFLRTETVELGPLLRDVHAKASAIAPRAWAIEAQPTPPIVADPQRLTQALMNLAANAADHTAPTDVIAFGAKPNGLGSVAIWVRDTGVGIAVEDQGHIFERFARGRGAPRRPQGAGLGLAIVRAIAEAHGGRVTVQSRPGEGATFTITLPTSSPENDK